VIHTVLIVAAGRLLVAVPGPSGGAGHEGDPGFQLSFESPREVIDGRREPDTLRHGRMTEDPPESFLGDARDESRSYSTTIEISCSIDDQGRWK